MAEGNVDRVTAKRVAGHITGKMWRKYSQVRLESIRDKMTKAFGTASITDAARPTSSRVAVTPGSKASADMMDHAIQDYLVRQVAEAVALALQRELGED